jgi:hypothetical protein
MLRVLFCFFIFFIGYEKTFGRKPTSRGHRTLHNASPTVNGLWFLLKKKRPRVALSLNDSHCYCELLRMHIQQCFWLTEPDYHNIVQTGSHTTDVRSVFSLVARAWHPSPSWCLFFFKPTPFEINVSARGVYWWGQLPFLFYTWWCD